MPESGTTAAGGALGTLQWAAEAAQRYPWWVVVGVLVGGALWLLWGQLEKRWEHQREVETERMRQHLALERDWLTAALRADDPEKLVPIARALGLGPDGERGEEDRTTCPLRTTGGTGATKPVGEESSGSTSDISSPMVPGVDAPGSSDPRGGTERKGKEGIR